MKPEDIKEGITYTDGVNALKVEGIRREGSLRDSTDNRVLTVSTHIKNLPVFTMSIKDFSDWAVSEAPFRKDPEVLYHHGTEAGMCVPRTWSHSQVMEFWRKKMDKNEDLCGRDLEVDWPQVPGRHVCPLDENHVHITLLKGHKP